VKAVKKAAPKKAVKKAVKALKKAAAPKVSQLKVIASNILGSAAEKLQEVREKVGHAILGDDAPKPTTDENA
jgi:hypothetical protein